MTIQNLGSVEVQYISCYYTRKMKVLFGDRRAGMNPMLTVYSDDNKQELRFVIRNVQIDNQRRNNVAEGLDLYLIKSEVTNLKLMLNSILDSVVSLVTINSNLRSSRDPRYTYNVETSGGLEIPIQILEGWVKVNEVRAIYGSQGYQASITSVSFEDNDTSINIEKENKSFWTEPRMHVGIHFDWTEEALDEFSRDEIIITIPWEELGQLIGRITASESRL